MVNDFFCGAGGVGLGFKQAGWKIAGSWDWNEYAVQTYKINVDSHVELRDISTLNGLDIPYAHCWTFGFPCQDISNAGKKAGLVEGERSKMFFEIMRLLDEVQKKPPMIMAENVKELKKWLPILKEEYNKAGYVMYVKLFNSKYWGVPQNRERYFVVGVRKDLDAGHFKFPKEQTTFIPKLSTVLEQNVDEKYYLKDEKAAKIIELALSKCENPQDVYLTKDGVAFACNARYYKGASYADVLKSRNTQIIEEVGITYCNTSAKFTDIAGTCIARGPSRGMGNFTPVTGVAEFDYETVCKETGLLNVDGIGKCLRVSGKGSAHSKKHNYEYLLEKRFRVRRLTPREYARLQGFPDDFVFECKDTRIYEQMGNAVTVSVAKAMGLALAQHLEAIRPKTKAVATA